MPKPGAGVGGNYTVLRHVSKYVSAFTHVDHDVDERHVVAGGIAHAHAHSRRRGRLSIGGGSVGRHCGIEWPRRTAHWTDLDGTLPVTERRTRRRDARPPSSPRASSAYHVMPPIYVHVGTYDELSV